MSEQLNRRLDLTVFRPIRTGNTFEGAVERILQAIKLGAYTYGDRLPAERDLAARLNVSRVTLRDAIRALRRAGYVESRRGRFGGTFVTYRPGEAGQGVPKPLVGGMGEGVDDALTFRRAVEIGAAEAAARAALTREQREYLRTRLRQAEQVGLTGYRPMDSRFHLAVAELSGSAMLAAAVADVRMRLNDLLDTIPALERNIEHSNAQHAAITEAILSGDPEGARRAMAEHLDSTATLLRDFLGWPSEKAPAAP